MHLALVAARSRIFKEKNVSGIQEKLEIAKQLVLFCSADAHLTVRKTAEYFIMRTHVVPLTSEGVFSPEELESAIAEEVENGNIPCMYIRLAEIFEDEIRMDNRFKLVTSRRAALVCFCLKAGNGPTKSLEDLLRETRKVDIRSANFPGTSDVILRFAVCSPYATESDIREAAALIKGLASQALELPRRMSESESRRESDATRAI